MRLSFIAIAGAVIATVAAHDFNPLVNRRHLVERKAPKYPYCQGNTYGITTAHCKKFAFDPNNTSNCVEPKNCTTFYDISKFKKATWSPKVVQFAELITNVFENGNTLLGYAYVQALGDGRGYTSGYIGFTTGTNDANYVVQEFIKRSPKNNPFSKYSKELKRLSALPFCGNRNARNDTAGLVGYPKVWEEQSCKNPAFVQTQLDVGRGMYVQPAMRFAAQYDVKTPLGFALFYDTIIQHGWQYTESDINLPRILSFTGKRSSFKTEEEFLNAFLKSRRQLLCCYPDNTWPPSADRVADLQDVMAKFSTYRDLTKPVPLKRYGVTVKGTEQIAYDSATCNTKGVPKGWKLPASKTWTLPTSCAAAKSAGVA